MSTSTWNSKYFESFKLFSYVHLSHWKDDFLLQKLYSRLYYMSLCNQLVSQDVKLVLDWDSVDVLVVLIALSSVLLLIHVLCLRAGRVVRRGGCLCPMRSREG